MLTEAMAKGVVPKRDVPAYVARQLRQGGGDPIHRRLGSGRASASEEKAYARYRALLNDTADECAPTPANGRAVFQRTCGACHKLYGEGGTIGPDLTGSNRANLDYLLFNVLNPNGEVQDAYKMVVVTTRDGRTFAGNVVCRDRRTDHAAGGRPGRRGHQQVGHTVARNDRGLDDAARSVRRRSPIAR